VAKPTLSLGWARDWARQNEVPETAFIVNRRRHYASLFAAVAGRLYIEFAPNPDKKLTLADLDLWTAGNERTGALRLFLSDGHFEDKPCVDLAGEGCTYEEGEHPYWMLLETGGA
jgi:hypothetical protein